MFLLWAMVLKGQQNLVPNSSFEDIPNCVGSGYGFISFSPPWKEATTQGSADIYNTCMIYDNPNRPVPLNTNGFQWPKTGNGYAAGYTWAMGWVGGEYPSVKLIQALDQRKKYRVGFYTVLAEESKYSTGTFGIYFSNTEMNVPGINLFDYEPQINFFLTPEERDTGNWILLEDTFTSIGGEQYLTFGNFKTGAESDTVYRPTGWNVPGYPFFTYYYYDDVFVYEIDTTLGVEESRLKQVNFYQNGYEFVCENPNLGKIDLNLFDASGRKVWQAEANKGNNRIPFHNLSPGIYFATLQSSKASNTRKLVVWSF